jgi:aryl-alcohol dehydrogenase-like predicted oxidoreductase
MITTRYHPDHQRYDGRMPYRRCGRSGLDLPAISLGLWQNFGGVDVFETGRAILRRAFDLGVSHFDLANNYGPPYGSAEENFGRWMAEDIGARTVEQLEDSLGALRRLDFTAEELERIDHFATDAGIDIWKASAVVTETA